ncbi:hypothetical protein LTS18_005111 [Coniosporium uncinatum]|uniref:Uncharacterized protein n=1 Tax=Coniosporium uncinatum TaxID=93489 RepID=A0ACC3DRT2_9PEZI|nr:hypothetical protein LTS18_005111 [Coniosporium uncinatum]
MSKYGDLKIRGSNEALYLQTEAKKTEKDKRAITEAQQTKRKGSKSNQRLHLLRGGDSHAGLKSDNLKRYMAAIRVPHIDMRINKTEWGVNCASCLADTTRLPTGETPNRRRLYTEQGFAEHFRTCPQTNVRLDSIRAHPWPVVANLALQDYQMQMMLLEQQNVKRRHMARQE